MNHCGSCTMCCKIMGVAELNKPGDTWCDHCTPGRGCMVYEDRPNECRDFKCLWLGMRELAPESVPDELRPDRSKVLFSLTADNKLMAQYDKGREEALSSPLVIDLLRKAVRRDGEAFVRSGSLVMTVK